MKKNKRNVNKGVPIIAIFIISLGVLSFALYYAGSKNVMFAEWLTVNAGFYARRGAAALTRAVPFSLAEVLIVLSPVVSVMVIAAAAKKNGAKARIRFLSGVLAMLSLFYTCYVFTLGIGYHRLPISSKIELDSVEVTRENLYSTLSVLKNECEALLDEIEYSDSGSSVSELDFDTVREEILSAYERLQKDYPSLEISSFNASVKEVRLSKVMTSLDLLGIYTFFTGESNVNVHYPDYTTPYTVAHELAHQFGISRENEANFIAFLVCIRSEDAYIRYSGYLNMFEYVASALSKTDRELLLEVYASLDARMYGELKAYSAFYQANKNELLGKISEFFNDKYLKSNGTEGVVSYGLVVELCVAYYSSNSPD